MATSLYSMVELLLQRIKEQQPVLADWTDAKEKFALITDPGVLMMGLKGFVAPHKELLEKTSRTLDNPDIDWLHNFEDLVIMLRNNFNQTGVSAMITVDWEKLEQEEDKREARLVAISTLLRRILLGVEWLPLWAF